MRYPSLLTPTTTEQIQLPSGVAVAVPKAQPVFEDWAAEPPRDTYGNKPILRINGKPAFAELAVLGLLSAAGWNGVWVDSFRGVYRTSYWPEVRADLPAEQQLLLQRISTAAGTTKGCWDVFCWQDGVFLFAECKHQNHDKIRDTQRKWLQAAITTTLTVESFLVVEWSSEAKAAAK